MYEFETASLSQDEYKMYLIEKERSDIDYIAMMCDVELETEETQEVQTDE